MLAAPTTHDPGPFRLLLRQYRSAAGFSQEELAERAGLSRRGVSDLERGARRLPHPGTARRLADALALDRVERAALLRAAQAAGAKTDVVGVAEPIKATAAFEPITQAVRHNLPVQLSRFIGRETELAELRHLLSAERLLTLTGAGGVGKTRLAIEVAASEQDKYPGGVWLVDLASLSEPTLVPHAVAAQLGVRAEAQLPLEQTLADFLKFRRVLLVLDNCEHLPDACAAMTQGLLRACPELRVLATSREPLRIPGERTWRVPSLSVPSSADRLLPDELLECESTTLFVDRASAAGGFAPTHQNAPAVARLCQRLDGIPLAIELAAARTGALSVEQIASRLDDRFRLLVSGSRTAPARQQTLQATINWSYDLLTASEKILLCRLSVFAGGWTIEAAEAVCAEDDVEPTDVVNLLARLAEKSLVMTELGSNGQMRYRLLESMRQYGLERLRAGGHKAMTDVKRRHCAHYRALAEESEAQGMRPAEAEAEAEWLVRLEAEQGNFRAALGWSMSEGGDPEVGLELAGRLGLFWYTSGDRFEGRAWLSRALERTAGSSAVDKRDTISRARAIRWAGVLAYGQHQYEDGVRLLEQALEMFQRLGDRRGAAGALHHLGTVAQHRADLDHATAFYEAAINAFREEDDVHGLITALAGLGATAGYMGQHDRALALLDESLSLARQTAYERAIAIASIWLGKVAHARGDDLRAARAWKEGLTLSRKSGDAWLMAECLEGLAASASVDEWAESAARLLGVAATLRTGLGSHVHPVDRAAYEQTIARAQVALGRDAFATAWAAGEAMALDEAVECALVARPRGRAGSSHAPEQRTHKSQLTAREREVAALIARGLSNRQIGALLVIAERTATNHVEHILNKLGFHSRTQVAAWATEQRLVATSE